MVYFLYFNNGQVYGSYFNNGQAYGLFFKWSGLWLTMQRYEHIFRIYVEKSIKVCNLR